ncbi:MAG: glycosyltransferase family 4 protein [Magnetococcales bacterium]|nr:glycosyltransferase family 4 protein [Magnetococcales bacterium]
MSDTVAHEAKRPITVLFLSRTNAPNVVHHIEPLLYSEVVERVVLIRNQAIPLEHPKLQQKPYNLTLREGGKWRRTLRFGWHLLRFLFSGVREVVRCRPHLVVSINPFPYGVLAWLVGVVARRPTVWMIIGDDLAHFQRPWLARLLVGLSRFGVRMTVPGAVQKAVLVTAGVAAERIWIMPHTVDPARFHPAPQRQDNNRGGFDILFVGGLYPPKGPHLLCEAMRQVVREVPGARLLLVGRGDLEPHLRQSITAWQLEKSIVLAGAVHGEALIRLYQDARIFALPSETEGFPFVLVEALCTDTVPVITAVGAIGEVIEDGVNGVLLAPQPDVATLSQALVNLLRDSKYYASLLQGVRTTAARFGHDRAAQVWATIISSPL